MRVLLANSPWTVNGIKGVRAGSRWPHLKIPEEEDYMPFPFFLAYSASLLKKNNIDVLLIDTIAGGVSNSKFLAKIKDYKPDIVLLEVSTPSLKADLGWALRIKKLDKHIKIALAGLDMNIRNPKFLEKNGFIDFVLVGEYEFTLLGLIKCLKNKDKLNNVLGLIYRDKRRIIINKKRPLTDINKLPWPLREQLPMHKYHDCPGGIPQPSVQVLASRGCPYQCIFCAWPQIMYHGNNYRARNPIDVVDEMEFLVRKKGFKSVYFDDDTFNIGRKRMLEICNEIKKRKLKVPWAIMARADLMDKELLDEMKSAGLYAVKYGIESAVQKLVDNANKDLNLKKAEEMIKYINKIGIKTHLTFMFGLPGETHETIQKTIEFALKMNPESVQFSITTPFPGTSYYKELDKRSMLVSKKWSDYDGNFKSVIKTKELSAKELENAVRIAYNAWAEHRQERIKHKDSSLITLKKCLNEHGLEYTSKRIVSKVFKKKDMNKKKQEQKIIPKKNLILKNFYDNRLDLIGVVDEKHAFTFPNLVQIDLTNKCNNSCIGCWCNSPLLDEKKISRKEKEETLPYNRIISLIDELKKHETNEIYLGGGGEPFMHPKIMEIVEHIKRNKLVCHINTNFTLINEKIAKKLVDLDADHIAVSLWAGDAETYVKTHPNQTKKTFYQIEKILRLIKKIKQEQGKEKPLIKIYNVISSLNYKNIEKMAEFAYRTADSVEFSVIDVVEGKTDSLLLNEKQRKELLKKSLIIKREYNKKGKFVIFRFDQFLKRISNPLSVRGLYDKKAVDSIPCYVGWTFSRILANGDVIPCLKAHKKPIGNIINEGFDTVFFSEKYNQFRFKAKNFKKNNEFFRCINCYKTCDDLGRNNEMHKQMSSLSSDEKEMLNYARDLMTIKGMIRFLNKKKIKIIEYKLEQKKILDNILNWDIKKINWKIDQIYNKINKKVTSVQIRWNNSELNKTKLQQKIRKIISKQESNLDILLVMCPPWDTKMPPMGLAYLVSNLKSKGIKTELVDINIELYNLAKNKYKGAWNIEDYNEWVERSFHLKLFSEFHEYMKKVLNFIIKKQASIIGLSVNVSNLNFSYELAKRLKSLDSNLKICIGGPSSNLYILNHKIRNYIDFAIVGEAEDILPKLMILTKKKQDFNNPFETFLSKEGIIFIKAKPLENINIISTPTYSEFDLSKYEEKVLPMLASRGCVNRCNFCIDWIQRKCYSLRLPEKIIEELEYHIQHNKIKRFNFRDLIINGNLKHLEKICDLIIKKRLKIEWCAQGTINLEMGEELLKKIKLSGCTNLVFGVESCSNKVLKSMNKPFKAEHLKLFLKRLKKAGIGRDINLIIGYPSEDEEEFEETYDFIDKYYSYINRISSLTPCLLLSNSWLSENMEKFNIIVPRDKKSYLKWYNMERTNTYEIRKERIKKIVELANYHGIKTPLVNLYDETSLINKLPTKSIKLFSSENTNSNVLLVICPPWDPEMPPLGLAYLASSLEREGFIPQIFDLNIELYNIVEDCDKSLWKMSNYLKWTKFNIHNKFYKENAKLLNQFYKLIERVKPLSICFSINISNYNSSLELIKEIKRKFPESKMGVGGPNIDEDYFMKSEMKDHVDFAVIGEGEIVLPKVLKQIKHDLSIEKIEGILIPSKFDQRKINVSPVIKDLDSIPFPTYKGFPLQKYTQRVLPIFSSRGCIRRCAYCSDWKMGRKYRIRSAENIFEEIKYHISHNNIKNFDFKDLLINGDINILNRLCDLLIQSDLEITWSGQGIIRKEMTPDLLKKMKKSGFSTITYGVESFSDKILKKMRKGATKEIIDNVLHNTYKAGIRFQINLIIGFPGETEQDFEKTLSYLRKNSKIISSVSSLSPLSIYGNSDIELNPDSYGISYPKNINFHKWLNKGGNFFWKDKNGIGFEKRMLRLKRIMNLLNKLNIHYPAFDFDAVSKITNDIRKNNKMETNYDSYLGVRGNLIKVFFERLKGKLTYIYSKSHCKLCKK